MPVGFSTTVRIINPSSSPRNSPRPSLNTGTKSTKSIGGIKKVKSTQSHGKKRKTRVNVAKRSKRASQKKRGRKMSKRQRGGMECQTKTRIITSDLGEKTKMVAASVLNPFSPACMCKDRENEGNYGTIHKDNNKCKYCKLKFPSVTIPCYTFSQIRDN